MIELGYDELIDDEGNYSARNFIISPHLLPLSLLIMNIIYHEDASLPSNDTDCLLARPLKSQQRRYTDRFGGLEA
jgi:hypothetical protein